MKVLYLYDTMPGLYQNYLRVLLKALQDNISVKTLSYDGASEADYPIQSRGVSNKFQKLSHKIGWSNSPSEDAKVMSEFDIVHVQHSYLRNKLSHFSTSEKKPKLVVTLRGGDTYMKPWHSPDWRDFYKEKSQHIDAFVVMSEHQKQYLQRWGVSEDKIEVIPISFGYPSNAKPKYPNKDKMKLISAFRMTWEKNIEGCVRFASELKKQGVPFSYDIFGDGKDLAQLYFLVDKYNLTDVVHIKGKINNDELKSRLTDYDFFLQLSFSEALPTTILEAQSAGLPCVVSNAGGIPEAVLKNETALVEDYMEINKLATDCSALWNDKERYYSFSKKSIEHCNQYFATPVECEKLIALYEKLLKN